MKLGKMVKVGLAVAVVAVGAVVIYRVVRAGPSAGTVGDRIRGAVKSLVKMDTPGWLSSKAEVAQAVDTYGLPPGVASKADMDDAWSYDTASNRWVLEKG